MERPIMHPQFLSDTETETQTKTKLRFRHIKRAARAVWRLLRSELFFWRSTSGVRIEDAAPIVRFVRGLLYRMAFVPIIVVLIVVVMVVGLRGSRGGEVVGCTFGFNESQDVTAAIEKLRKEPMVDGNRVGVLGTGSGATAALLAAQRDGRIRAMVLHNPIRTSEELVDRLGPSEPY